MNINKITMSQSGTLQLINVETRVNRFSMVIVRNQKVSNENEDDSSFDIQPPKENEKEESSRPDEVRHNTRLTLGGEFKKEKPNSAFTFFFLFFF